MEDITKQKWMKQHWRIILHLPSAAAAIVVLAMKYSILWTHVAFIIPFIINIVLINGM